MPQVHKSKQAIEIASIAGIAAIFVFAEVNFGLFAATAVQINRFGAGFSTYGLGLFIGAWIGLITYSLRRRADLRREVEARILAEENFALQRITDPVTGLPNRQGFELVLNQRLRQQRGSAFTVLNIEICNLDTIISVHGSEIATRLEIAIAERLAELLTPEDFLARGGRASFYAFCSGEDIDQTRFHIDSVIEQVSDFSAAGIEANAVNLQTYVTFGVLTIDGQTCSAPEWDAESVMRRIDYASLRARRRGSGAIEVFDWNMESDMQQRAIIEASLARAIDSGQIVPYFQPLIDLTTHRVSGLEILARWTHPAQGEIPPAVFIPVAEDTGILRLLTLSLLRQACEAARDWPEQIRLAINISPTDLRDPALIDKFVATLHDTGTAPGRIEVEITENALVEEAGSIAPAVQKLKDNGIALSIDDFGTGYSSLHHLRILPFDKIKIDQSFIKDMATNKESRAIVQAIIAMAQSLGLQTTAEGIELGNNADTLQQFGCSIGQGFLYARPLAAKDVAPFLENFQRQIGARAVA